MRYAWPGSDHAAAIQTLSSYLGGGNFEIDQMESSFGNLVYDLADAAPGVLSVPGPGFLLILRASQKKLQVLDPSFAKHWISVDEVADLLRGPVAGTLGDQCAAVCESAGLSGARRTKAMRFLLEEQLGNRHFDQAWILRPAAGAKPRPWLAQAGIVRNAGIMVAAHTAQYLLWLASWAIMGSGSLSGRLDRGWVLAWALLLITLIPFRLATTWTQGLLAVGLGGLLKRRLLVGALRLSPEEVRHLGIGAFVSRCFEAESIESTAVSGAIDGLLAAVELAIAGCILGRFSLVLLVCILVACGLGWRFWSRYRVWTDARMALSLSLIESMSGHRTRLTQQPRARWHEEEDRSLAEYYVVSTGVDRAGILLTSAIPRVWLIAGLACLLPAIASGAALPVSLATTLGGVLLAYAALRRLTGSFVELVAAAVAWSRTRPLYRAAARPVVEGLALPADSRPTAEVMEADRIAYRYASQTKPVIQDCSLAIRRGDRILLEGASGAGKTTLASILTGMRVATSGLLLANGLDRHTLGDENWRRFVASAPQFHENHILSESLAFNLLMGRAWPPAPEELEEAEELCRELGLGTLIDAMPAGLLQQVGEGGWQLSHGERSRIFIARALLQKSGMVVLDESFAALDPLNLQTALECTLSRAETLLVIAHP